MTDRPPMNSGRQRAILACSHSLYAVRPQGMAGPIKLGRTKRLSSRLRQLESEIGRDVELLAAVPEWWCTESDAMKLFAAHRIWSEWFTPHPELLAFIEAMARAQARCASMEGALRRILDLKASRPLALIAEVERELGRRARWRRRMGIDV